MFDYDHLIRAYKWRAMSSMPYNENGSYHKEKEKCVIHCAMCHHMKKYFLWGYQTIDRRREKTKQKMQKEASNRRKSKRKHKGKSMRKRY
jgi:hypothetical protein